MATPWLTGTLPTRPVFHGPLCQPEIRTGEILMSDLTEDIVELQTRLQFQEDVIHKLDTVVIQQSEVLDALRRRLAVLEERLEQLDHERESTTDTPEPRPPHY